MANERAIRRRAKLALSALACLLCQGRGVAATDVAAVLHKDPARLEAPLAASAGVNQHLHYDVPHILACGASGTAPAGSRAVNRIETE